MAQLDAGVGHHLNQPLEVKLGRHRNAGAVEHLERARFFPHLADARFKRLVDREQPRFERLALGDVEDRPAQQRRRVAVYPPLGGNPVQAAVRMPDPELDAVAAGLRRVLRVRHGSSGRRRRRSACCQLRKRPFGLLRIDAEQRPLPAGSSPTCPKPGPLRRCRCRWRLPPAGAAPRTRARAASRPALSRSLSCMQRWRSHLASRMALASLIARSLPSAICRGRWLNPQELVTIVCSARATGGP